MAQAGVLVLWPGLVSTMTLEGCLVWQVLCSGVPRSDATASAW